jgi:hypothetical protein
MSAQPGNLFSPPVKYARTASIAYEYRTARVAALWKPNENSRRSSPTTTRSRPPAASLRGHIGGRLQPAHQPGQSMPATASAAAALQCAGAGGDRPAVLGHQQLETHQGQGGSGRAHPGLRHGVRDADLLEFLRAPQQPVQRGPHGANTSISASTSLLRNQNPPRSFRARTTSSTTRTGRRNPPGIEDRGEVRLGGGSLLQGSDHLHPGARVLSGLQRLLQRLPPAMGTARDPSRRRSIHLRLR